LTIYRWKSKLLEDKEKIGKAENQMTKTGIQKKEKRIENFPIKISVTDDRLHRSGYSYTKSELYIYDIPKKYQGEAIIKNFGKVKSYVVKKLHKYQLIKAEIHMSTEWIRLVNEKSSYTTVSYKGEILNLRYVFADVEKSKVDEAWKRKGLIKMPGYDGKRDDLKAIMKYLREKNLDVPFIYGKNLIIQGELYFWAIFANDDRVKLAEKLSREEGVDNGWEILSNFKSKIIKKEKERKNLLSTTPEEKEKEEKNKKKEKYTPVKSQLRKEYEANTTESQNLEEDKVKEFWILMHLHLHQGRTQNRKKIF
jgi:hypothetical protein